jgi:PAS domain S-box-containing protein
MNKDPLPQPDGGTLRRRAEEQLVRALPADADSLADMQKLLHELQVHQIELEMQNEELRAAQAEVQAGLARYTELYDFAPIGYFTLARDNTIRQANLAGVSLLGLTRSQLKGQRFVAFLQPSYMSTFNDFLSRTFARRLGENCEVVLLPVGQNPQLVVQITGLADDAGQSCKLVVQDITLRKQAEEVLRQRESEAGFRVMANAMPQLAWIAQPNGDIIWFNEKWYGYTGTTPEQMGGGGWQLVHDPLMLPKVLERWEESIATGKPFEMVFPLRRADGSFRHFLTRAAPQLDPLGQILRWFGTNTDIAEQKSLEEALRSANAESEQANAAKSRFLAAASHDLRQPLQALGLYLGVLGGKLSPADAPIMKNIDVCVTSLSRLLTDLLDMSKLDAGVVATNPSRFAINDMLDTVVSGHAPVAERKGLRLRQVTSGLIADTDPVLLERIVGNLVANAIRYTDRGGVVVGCRRSGGKAWIEVWDSGIGIPLGKTAEIFEEFSQLGNHERNSEKGTGLGLAIVRKTAALLGLEVRVASRLGRGSMFAIELPCSSPK